MHNTKKDPKEDDENPIVFSSPGLTPDVRLTVFGREFHVHSIVLKLHSNFFRKFLDAGNKTATPASSLFQYDYVSVLDDDGTWGLETSTSKVSRLYQTWKVSFVEEFLPFGLAS